MLFHFTAYLQQRSTVEQDNEKSQLENVGEQNRAAFIMIYLKLQHSGCAFFVANVIESKIKNKKTQSNFHIVAAVCNTWKVRKKCISSSMAQDWIHNEQALDSLIIKQ